MKNKKMLEIVFHVGPHKTATTSFQSFLFTNTKKLVAKGTLVPKWGTIGHHQLPWAIMGFNAKLLGALNVPAHYLIKSMLVQAKAFASHRIILSSEDFSLLSISQWRDLRKMINKANDHFRIKLKCVYSLRSGKELQRSIYWELVKHGYPDSYQESESKIRKHIYKTKLRLALIPLALKEKVPYVAENHEKLVASIVLPDADLEELTFSPILQNRSSTTPTLIEEIRKINESFGLSSTENLFHWPPVFSVESWAELQERHRRVFLETETER